MKFDTEQLLARAERLAQAGHLELATFVRRRSSLHLFEGRLATKWEHVAAYEESRAQLTLDGTPLAWERWRAEHHLLTLARAEASRLEDVIRFEMELLESEVALALQRQARALAEGAQKEARA